MTIYVVDKVRGGGGAVGLALAAVCLMILLHFPASAAEKLIKPEIKKDKSPVFEVPTTGRIIDVQYHPEFDEWWVTCREGENITVYSYDKRSQRWGQATFTPRGGEHRASKSALKERETSTSIEKAEESPATVKPQETPKPEAKTQEYKREADKASKTDSKRWWDPVNLIKQGGEKLLQPFQ